MASVINKGEAMKFQIILDGNQYEINPHSIDPKSSRDSFAIWNKFALDCATGVNYWAKVETTDGGVIVLGKESLKRAVYRSFKE
jgi:hypothetical protein